MTQAELLRRHDASHRSFYRVLARGAADNTLVELANGVQATVVPARPERSILNAVLYTEPAALIDALPQLTELYADAGVQGWGVWTPPEEGAVTAALAANGMERDSWPMVMAAPLNELELDPRREIQVHAEPTFAIVAELNNAAYGIPPQQSFATALAELDDPDTVAHVAEADGVPAACVVGHHHEGDCYLYFVATLPDARGQGLAGELVRLLLRRARDAGCTTTSLESTAMGQSVYAAVGYRELGPIELWERRVA